MDNQLIICGNIEWKKIIDKHNLERRQKLQSILSMTAISAYYKTQMEKPIFTIQLNTKDRY